MMLNRARTLTPELIRLRRDMHRHPELSFQEVRTARLVAETLQELGGFTLQTGVSKTGVVAQIGPGGGPCVAIRADMDALPITEETGAEYASVNRGVMHACGHDAHTAILLGVAHLLKESFGRDKLPGTVRLLFQPAEENSDAEGKSGAMRMVEEGVLEGVDVALALHTDSSRPCGQIGIYPGWTSASSDSFEAWVTASGGHGAYPHLGTDPIWMLGPVLTALHGIVARRVDPLQTAVVSLGQLQAGTASNVIPHQVYLRGTLRSFEPVVRQQLVTEVERALEVVRPLGGDFRLAVKRGYPAGWNDPTVAGWLAAVGTNLLGAEAVDEVRMGMGAEDFAYMCQVAPGAIFTLGSALPDGLNRGHHTNIFDIDEQALPIGAAILAETTRRILAGEVTLPD